MAEASYDIEGKPKSLKQEDDYGEAKKLWWRRVLDFVTVCLLCCVLLSAFMLLFYPLLFPVTPAVDLRSFSQSNDNAGAGVRPYNITWDVTLRFSNPSSHTPLSYNHLIASLTWFDIACTDPIRLAAATLPAFRQGTRASTLINSALQPVDLPQQDSCDLADLLAAHIWRFRLEVQGGYDEKLPGGSWTRTQAARRLGCAEITIIAATGGMIDHPTDCTP